MSDLASSQLLKASAAQLPVFTYFDPAYYALEQQVLFANAPQYYGHELMVPNAGDYFTFDELQVPIVVVRGNDMKVRAFYNIEKIWSVESGHRVDARA